VHAATPEKRSRGSPPLSVVGDMHDGAHRIGQVVVEEEKRVVNRWLTDRMARALDVVRITHLIYICNTLPWWSRSRYSTAMVET